MACLDTSLLVDVAGGGGRGAQARARTKLAELLETAETLATTRFNVAELWVGVERSRDPDAERRTVEAILEPLAVLEFDEASARAFGRITAYLRTMGSPRGDMDVLIASVALVHGEDVIVTRNRAHFEGIPGLRLETY
jgi:predicted nucleic acid-binding protein